MTAATRGEVRSMASVPTASASRYLQQLCKHFAHKIPVHFDPLQGEIEFPAGMCSLDADEAMLRLSLAPFMAEQLPQLEDVVTRHLVRFAFREDLRIDWRRS